MTAIDHWLKELSPSSRPGRACILHQFESWLERKNAFKNLDEAVAFQKSAVNDDRYKIVDSLVEFVREFGGTYNSMSWRYATIRSFFLHSRAELPKTPVNLAPTKDATVARLSIDVFKTLLKSSNLRDQAIYLSLFQGLMDQHRCFSFFIPRGYELGQHIQNNGVDKSFRVDFLRGRKTNMRPYNTWLGHDALEAWRVYFERERGYPKQGESAALDQYGKSLSKIGFFLTHNRRLRRLQYIKGRGKRGETRYGYNLHELRDLARSLLEKAKSDDFNTLSAEFWMGHTVDPMFYNKVWEIDHEYNLTQYKIAEKYLNIISESTIRPELDTDEIVKALIKHPELRQYIRSVTTDMEEIAKLQEG